MRPRKVIEEDLINGMMAVLRAKGYYGASLNELANSSGLKKASLYHRFPGGKQEIATAVLLHVDQWVQEHIVLPISDGSEEVADRIDFALDKINELYHQGQKACILRALSTKSGLSLFGDLLNLGAKRWITGFARLGEDIGWSKEHAKEKATEVLIMIQGSLVVTDLLGKPGIFEKTLTSIRTMYTK